MVAGLHLPELLVILGIVVIVFGVGRISQVAGEMGRGINAFQKGLKGELDETDGEENLNEESRN